MKFNNLDIKSKTLLVTSALLLIINITACGNKSEDESKKAKKEVSTSAPVIEVVQNSNAKEIKVKTKTGSGVKNAQQKSYYYDYGVKNKNNQNAQPTNKDASVRVKPRTAIDANMNIRSPYEEVQISLLTQKLSKHFRVKCSACHDDYANGIIGPSLLGRDADYIYKKISEFKDGTKSNPLMTDLINMMDDKEIKELANEIYQFNQKLKEIRNK